MEIRVKLSEIENPEINIYSTGEKKIKIARIVTVPEAIVHF